MGLINPIENMWNEFADQNPKLYKTIKKLLIVTLILIAIYFISQIVWLTF